MTATRLLVIGDHACQTGFARVVRGVADALDATGRYEIRVRAINFTPQFAHGHPYEVRPVTSDPATDPLGVLDLEGHLEAVKPDAVLIVQDLWHQMAYLARMPRTLPTIGYFPVDCPNLKWSYALAGAGLTRAVTYTQFGAREAAAGMREAADVVGPQVERAAASTTGAPTWFSIPKDGGELHCRLDRMARLQNPTGWDVVPHGVDLALFRPEPQRAARAQYGIPESAFVVLNVNTNQFRKRQDLTIRAFARFARTRPEALLILHCMGGSSGQGWDLSQLARYYGVQHQVVLVHQKRPVLTDDELRVLYNTADVQINTAGGEGWGLSSFEGAACGIPQLVPDWSATRELWAGAGVLLPVADWRHEPKMLNTAHAILSVPGIVAALERLYEDTTERSIVGEQCYHRAHAQVGWPEVATRFDRLITAARREAPARACPMSAVVAARRGVCRSELVDGDLMPAPAPVVGA
jgi:D-inositol-3-phosphate glycosyltransferase